MPSRSRTVAIAALLAGSVVVALGIAEGLIRAIDPPMAYPYMPQEIHVSHYRPSTLLEAELKPNHRGRFKMLEFDTTVVTNSLGLRDNEIDRSKPRFLCLGDSFTFGYGVENDEAFCARLERLFGGRYDFVNAGFADGYSPDAYAVWLRAYADRIAPQAILVSFFQNDVSDVVNHTWMRDGGVMPLEMPGMPDRITQPGYIVTPDGAGMRDNVLVKMPPWFRRRLKQSYLVAFLRDRLLRDAERPVTDAPPPPPDAVRERKFRRSLDFLREQAGATPLVFYVIGGAPAIEAAAPTELDRLVADFAREHAIPLLSNNRDFVKTDFYPLDSHFTAEGHRKAAAYLHRKLRELGY